MTIIYIYFINLFFKYYKAVKRLLKLENNKRENYN